MVIKSRRKPVHIGHKPDYPKIQRLLRENGYDLLTETWDGKPLTDLGNVVEDVPKEFRNGVPLLIRITPTI